MRKYLHWQKEDEAEKKVNDKMMLMVKKIDTDEKIFILTNKNRYRLKNKYTVKMKMKVKEKYGFLFYYSGVFLPLFLGMFFCSSVYFFLF